MQHLTDKSEDLESAQRQRRLEGRRVLVGVEQLMAESAVYADACSAVRGAALGVAGRLVQEHEGQQFAFGEHYYQVGPGPADYTFLSRIEADRPILFGWDGSVNPDQYVHAGLGHHADLLRDAVSAGWAASNPLH
jgi:hypothetical protein